MVFDPNAFDSESFDSGSFEFGAVFPGTGSLTVTGRFPSDVITINTTGSLSLTGQAPLVQSEPLVAAPGIDALVITGIAPSVLAGSLPAVGSIDLTGVAPFVGLSSPVVGPDSISLALTGNAPQATVFPLFKKPASDSLALTGMAPGVLSTVSPRTGTLVVIGTTPFVSSVQIPEGAMVITGQAPTVRTANAGTAIVNAEATLTPSNYEVCARTGFRALPGDLVRDGYGNLVLAEYRDSRHPQELVRSKAETTQGPINPAANDEFIEDVYPNGVSVNDL